MSVGAAVSETRFRDRARNQPVVGTFLSKSLSIFYLPNHISVQQTAFILREVLGESKRDRKRARGRCPGFVATRSAGKRVAVYYQRPGDASAARRGARPSGPDPAPHPWPGAPGCGGDAPAGRADSPRAAHPTPRGASASPARGPRAHPARRPPRGTSEARVVVSGPNLSDFDGAPTQGGQDQSLAQEVAARVAEGVRLGRHVRALRKGAGGRGAATSDGRGGRDPGGGGDGGGGHPGSVSSPRSPRRVHVVWNRKTERRDTGSEGRGAESVTVSPPPRPTGGGSRAGSRGCWSALDQGGAHAELLLVRAGAGRCPSRAAIGLRWCGAVPGPRQQRLAGGSACGGWPGNPVRELAGRGGLPGVPRGVGAGEATGWVRCIPQARCLASVLTANLDVEGILSPAFFSIEEKTGLARSSWCRLRAELAAGAVARQGTPVLSLHSREDSRDIAKVTVAACIGSGVLRHQAVGYFIMRHAFHIGPFTFTALLAKCVPPIPRASQWVVVITSHIHTHSALPSFLSF